MNNIFERIKKSNVKQQKQYHVVKSKMKIRLLMISTIIFSQEKRIANE